MALEDVIQGVQVIVKTDGVDDAKEKITQLDKALSDLSKTAEGATGSSSGSGSGVGGLSKGFSDLNTVAAQAFATIARSAVSGDLTGLATMMGGPVAGSFVETSKAIVQFIDTQDAAIMKNAALAKEMGTTPTVIQGLKESFEGAGVSAGGFERLVNRMSRQVQNDYADMTRNIRTDSDTQEGALLRLQAAEEKLKIARGADPSQFAYQDKIRAQKQAQIEVDQAEEAVRQQALKSIPHVTELLQQSMITGRASADLTEVSTRTLRESIEHLAQTGEGGPAKPLDVLKTEFDLIKSGAIGADKAVELLKEQMGSMRAAGLGGMDAQHLADYAKAHGGAGIEAAQAGTTAVQTLGLGQTAADTQKATETITEWSKFTGLFGAMLQKIGSTFSGKDSLLDATLRGGENTIGFLTDMHRRLQAASDAATGSTIAERSKQWWNAFQNPPKPEAEKAEAAKPVAGSGGLTVESVGNAKIYHVPEGYNGPADVTKETRRNIGEGPGQIIQIPPGYGGAPATPIPADARFEHMSVSDAADAPWRSLRSGGGAPPPPAPAAPAGPISDGGIVIALQSIASRIMGVQIPAAVGQGASAVAPIPGRWQGGGIPGFADGGGYDTSGLMGGMSRDQLAADIDRHPDRVGGSGLEHWNPISQMYQSQPFGEQSDRARGIPGFAVGGLVGSWDRLSDKDKQGAISYFGSKRAAMEHYGVPGTKAQNDWDALSDKDKNDAVEYFGSARAAMEHYRVYAPGSYALGGLIPGFANGGTAGPLDPMTGLINDGIAVGSQAWEAVKSMAPGSVKEARDMALELIRGHITGAAMEKTAVRGLEAAGIYGLKHVVGTGVGVLSNPFNTGLIDATTVGAADYNAGARDVEARGRARGAHNLKELSELGEGMWSGGIPGFAQGSIRGPGTGTSDSILARLSNGEFVMKDAAVRTYGEGFMHAINNMQIPPPKYALGGMVPTSSLPRFAEGGAMERPGSILNLHVGGEVFSGLKAPAAVADQLRKFAINQQTSQTGRKPSWAGG